MIGTSGKNIGKYISSKKLEALKKKNGKMEKKRKMLLINIQSSVLIYKVRIKVHKCL